MRRRLVAGTVRSILPVSFILGLLLLAACQSGGPADQTATEGDSPAQRVQTAAGSYLEVGPEALDSMLAKKDFLLVNVHVPYEGEIDGTDAFIPYDEVGDRLGELPADRAAKIFLYCRSGMMSAIAAETLLGNGYTNVWNLAGGMIAWQAAGYPLPVAQ